MIPTLAVLTEEITPIEHPSRTYKIEKEKDRINGYADEIAAVIQSIYLILNTERYKYVIYSWNYGVELDDLFGKPMPYVMSELERRIKEALTMDSRIDDVKEFTFTRKGHRLHVTFTVISNVAHIPTELEVDV